MIKVNCLTTCRFTLRFTCGLALLASAVKFVVFDDWLTSALELGIAFVCIAVLKLIENEQEN
tara:strand:- start:276 stop:461 length:186 start_codon:yes stop_codon:yes gene_type:complete